MPPSQQHRLVTPLHWIRTHLFFFVGLERFLFAAVVVRHGDDGQDHVDEVERTEEDHQHEEDDLILTVRLDRLRDMHAQ